MSPATNLAYYLLWSAHPVLLVGVLAAMVWRQLHRTFPVFFAYVVAQIAIFALIFPVYVWASPKWFFYTYWATTAVSIILGFRVLHEVFLDVFRPYHTLRDLGTVLFKWATLVMLLVAGVVAASTPSDIGAPMEQGVLTLQRSVRVVQCGLVLLLLIFSRYLGITWRQKSFGIALGFGGFASVELLLVALRVGHVEFTLSAQSLLNMATYNVAILTWLVYVLVKSPAREIAANTFRPERWEVSLNDIQHPRSPESLIPMFESMVERALSRARREPSATDPARSESETNRSSASNRDLLGSPQETSSRR
jgi:hypothetical protein